MADIIAIFADGRLLVQEDRLVQTNAISGGFANVRIGNVKNVERVLSIDAEISGSPDQKLNVSVRDVLISGDMLMVPLRRMDIGTFNTLSGFGVSGALAYNYLSGLTSGLNFMAPLLSGVGTSGQVRVFANVIAL